MQRALKLSVPFDLIDNGPPKKTKNEKYSGRFNKENKGHKSGQSSQSGG